MNFNSINTRLAVLIGVIVSISVAGFVLVVSSMTNSAVMSIQEQNMEVMNNMIVGEVEDFLSLSRTDLIGFSNNREFKDALINKDSVPKATRSLKELLRSYKNLTGIAAFDLDGKVIFGMGSDGHDMSGLDLRRRDYVGKVINGQDFVVSDVLISKSGNGLIVVMAVPIRGEDGRIMGGIFASLDWKKYSNRIIGDISIGEHGYPYILDGKGRIIAHKVNDKIILKNLSDLQFVKDSLATSKGSTRYSWEGKAKVQYFETVPMTGWVVCMSAYVSDLTQAATDQRNILLGMGALMILLLVSVIVFSIRRQVTGPMDNIKNFTNEIAQGNFKEELHGEYVCELSDLAQNIKHMVSELKHKLGFSEGVLNGLVLPCGIVGPDSNMIWVNSQMCDLIESKIRPENVVGLNPGEFFYGDKSRRTLSQKAIDEKRQMQTEVSYTTSSGTHKDISVSTTPFYDMDKNMLGSVTMWIDMTEIRDQQRKIEANNHMISEAAVSATDVSNQVTSFSEALAAQVEQSSRGAEEQSMMASEAATAMDEMNSTVFEVAKNAATAADLAAESQRKAGEGEKMVASAVETILQVHEQSELLQRDMAELGKQADGIGNIMGVISDIADQTNLLALNAAIEAARAGDAGRGFAVVADEVRKLAEKTMTATSEVGEYITNIQNSAQKNIANTERSTESINIVTDLVNKSGDVLKEIVDCVAETTDQVRSIATASEQQSAASEEISRSTGQINSIASETAQAMNESAEAVSRMSELAQELNGIIARMQN